MNSLAPRLTLHSFRTRLENLLSLVTVQMQAQLSFPQRVTSRANFTCVKAWKCWISANILALWQRQPCARQFSVQYACKRPELLVDFGSNGRLHATAFGPEPYRYFGLREKRNLVTVRNKEPANQTKMEKQPSRTRAKWQDQSPPSILAVQRGGLTRESAPAGQSLVSVLEMLMFCVAAGAYLTGKCALHFRARVCVGGLAGRK
jgi:hypothetical protein